MENQLIALKAGAAPVERDGRYGVTFSGKTTLTADRRQIALLHALAGGAQPITALKTLLRADAQPGSDAFAALALAQFIIEFSEYLES